MEHYAVRTRGVVEEGRASQQEVQDCPKSVGMRLFRLFKFTAEDAHRCGGYFDSSCLAECCAGLLAWWLYLSYGDAGTIEFTADQRSTLSAAFHRSNDFVGVVASNHGDGSAHARPRYGV